MPAKMRDIYSSHVSQVGHDPDTNEMHVVWEDGKRSIYSDVPYEKFESVARSWSVGNALHSEIKPFHSHRYG